MVFYPLIPTADDTPIVAGSFREWQLCRRHEPKTDRMGRTCGCKLLMKMGFGQLWLILAVTIFGAANAFTQKLMTLGTNAEGVNLLTFCNLLLAGNIWALASFLVLGCPRRWPRLPRQDWLYLVGVAVLSGVIAPAATLLALERTSANNVVIISRVEPLLTLAVATWLGGERIRGWTVLAAWVSFLGVVGTLLFSGAEAGVMGLPIGTGEWLALGAAGCAAFGNVISQSVLQNISLGFFNIMRTLMGTVVFALLTWVLFGASHFQDLTNPIVWGWMLVYSLVIVVGGQLAWYKGLQVSTTAEIALAHSIYPIAGFVAAYLLLGEVPTPVQYVGLAFILLGIFLHRIGLRQQPFLSQSDKHNQKMMAVDTMGFQGF